MQSDGELILCGALMHGLGMHMGSWTVRSGPASDYVSPELALEVGRIAEQAKLHAVFYADALGIAESGTDRPVSALEPIMLLALMSSVTTKLGLVATASTTYSDPYLLARWFGTLDHLSHGRAGWNSVATFNDAAAGQFGATELPSHAERYARAEEFLDVTFKLWGSWEPDALVGDKARGVFARADGVHEINHVGEYFSVRGPSPFPRPPQGRPVIFQAGSSEQGREQAAKYADVVFTAQHLLDDAVEFRADMLRRAAKHGRKLKVLPGMLCHLGATHREAVERQRRLDEAVGTGPELIRLAQRSGTPVEALVLDEKFPIHALVPEDEFKGSLGFRRTLVNLAVKEDLTVRELLLRYGGGHHRVVGSAAEVADIMCQWQEAGAADGFNLMVDVLPSGLEAIRDLLVPELQRRGLFHTDYEGLTLRDSLGLSVPATGWVTA
ncbi:monooxygenase [Mycobacterium paraense]|uniref:Monooxygenase n=1 Tax=Mycobacterium paraense TaxID=767916 RepID=A0ABX3VRB7_9MYCO|nr:NtaA/DmoA family FMN-dependent monooxygenase [Mycobacterium paraense]ORW32750.1 monooxygenase [Mycobacterium paraense]ORW44976.1 monooxygenase [Mycobacterium paraense]